MSADDHDLSADLQTRINAAREHLDQAERDLRDVLREMERSSRSQKVIVGDSLRVALDQLADTRTKLEAAVRAGDDPGSD